MKIFKILLSIAILTLLSVGLHAQEVVEDQAVEPVDSLVVNSPINKFKEQLIVDVDSLGVSLSEQGFGTIAIVEDESAQGAIEAYAARTIENSVDGYRVGVYFNNSVNARSGAMDVVKRCEMLLPDIPATMSYSNPYFKVSVGYCISEEEAVIMLNRVQKHFPKAYLMRERVSVENIIASREKETTPTSSEKSTK